MKIVVIAEFVGQYVINTFNIYDKLIDLRMCNY